MSRSLFGAVVLLAAFTSVGCDDKGPTTPTPPAAPTITENFSGTLTVNGGVSYPFVVGTSGSVTATLTSVSPDVEVPIGMSLGVWNTTTESCQVIISSDLTLQGNVIVGNARSGVLCVRVYDVGRLTASTTYEVAVTHQ